MNAMLATLLDPHSKEFRITHVEMIKGIAGHGFYSNMVVPIIENTARECELTDRLREAIEAYPTSNAVLVRRHGVYVWGDNWIHAKTQFECYEYLFEAAVRMHHMGINPAEAPAPPPTSHGSFSNGIAHMAPRPQKRARTGTENTAGVKPAFVVLDIEGTVAPIAFVAETLFPYARRRLRSHLESSFDTAETCHDIRLIRDQASADGTSFPGEGEPRDIVIDAAVALCEGAMAVDKKTTALKSLQGHIWREGFARGELQAELYRDVPDALVSWRDEGIKTYIYSSGSRQAQKDLFAHTTVGDLRPYLQGFFDTTSGSKVDSGSYENIALSLGPDSPNDILFVTDNILEARAARTAGWRAVVAKRPGNAPLPGDCEFKVVESLTDIF